MRAVVFDTLATPDDHFAALRLADVPVPDPADDEALVAIAAASVNPGDLLFLQGLYPEPKTPTFPGQIAGGHAAGRIVRAGPDVPYPAGTLVAFSHDRLWAEHATVPMDRLIPLPDAYPLEKAAQFMNLITAWDLLAASGVQRDQWLAVTAGNATVSTMIAQFAQAQGVKVLAIVRKSLPVLDLRALGASRVIETATNGDLPMRISEATDGQGLAGAIDCVGGPLVADLVRSLTLGGRLIVYGGFRPEMFELHNFDLLMRGAAIETYIYRYFFQGLKAGDLDLMARIADASAPRRFRVPVAAMHPLEDFAEAVTETWRRPEAGKRFLIP